MTSFNHKKGRRIVEVREDFTIRAPGEAVFDKICEPCSLLQWHDGLESCKSSTDDQGRLTRHYVMNAVGEHPQVKMYEVELLRAPNIMTITYIVEVENMPLTDYHAQITVTPLTDTYCRAMIRSRFVRVETGVAGLDARDIVSDFYIAGLSKLSEIMRQD